MPFTHDDFDGWWVHCWGRPPCSADERAAFREALDAWELGAGLARELIAASEKCENFSESSRIRFWSTLNGVIISILDDHQKNYIDSYAENESVSDDVFLAVSEARKFGKEIADNIIAPFKGAHRDDSSPNLVAGVMFGSMSVLQHDKSINSFVQHLMNNLDDMFPDNLRNTIYGEAYGVRPAIHIVR